MSGQGPSVYVLIVEAEGSAPREAGAWMRVWADGFEGTIGGGALEHEAITHARSLLVGATRGSPSIGRDTLRKGGPRRTLRSYPLGPALGQCCGGFVRLMFETDGATVGARGARPERPVDVPGARRAPLRLLGLYVRSMQSDAPPTLVTDRRHAADWPVPVLRAVRQMLSGERPRRTLLIRDWIIEPEANPPRALYLYGAGHVGRAVVKALADLPFAITWIDIAAERFPETFPPNAAMTIAPDPAALAATAPPDALHLVMTFSHPLDLAITHAILSRPFAFAGLIGSATKRARFESRLRASGITQEALQRLACPIGIGGISGKEPAMIAISVAAQLAAFASAASGRLPGGESEAADKDVTYG